MPVVLACLAAIATAQDRRAIAGRVVDANGKPAARATVALWWSSPNGEAFAPTDAIECKADDAGRFRAELLPGLGYTACAVGADIGAAGARAVSAVSEDVVAGRGIELQLGAPAPPRRVRVANAAAWAALGPLRLRATPAARNARFGDVPLDGDGIATLPPWPEPFAVVEVRLGEQLLDRLQVDLEPVGDALPEARLGMPARLPVRVRDDHGAPLAGVTLLRAVPNPIGYLAATFARVPAMRSWQPAGTTDAEGKAELLLPAPRDPFAEPIPGGIWLVARAAGRRDSIAGFDGCRIEDGREVKVDRREVRFTLAPGERTVRGRVVLPGGAPLREHAVQLRWISTVHEDGNDTSFDQQRIVRTDADGRFAFGHLTAECLVHDLELAPLPPSADAARHWRVPTVPALRPWPAENGGELLLDLGAARTLPIEVRGVDGAPSPSAVAFVLPLDKRTDPDDARTRVFLDPAGRAELQLGPGEWLIGVTDGLGWATATTTIGAERDPTPLRVALQPLAEVRGTVVFADGRPAVGARFEPDGGGGEVADDLLVRLTDGFAVELNLAQLSRTRTDAEGRFVLRLAESPRQLLRGVIRAEHKRVEMGVLRSADEPRRYELK